MKVLEKLAAPVIAASKGLTDKQKMTAEVRQGQQIVFRT